jgi:excisionase family DNA binding protein
MNTNTQMPADVLLTIPQALDRLKVSRTWIYKMRKQGKIVIVKLGGMSRIRSSEVERLLTHGTELPTNCPQRAN